MPQPSQETPTALIKVSTFRTILPGQNSLPTSHSSRAHGALSSIEGAGSGFALRSRRKLETLEWKRRRLVENVLVLGIMLLICLLAGIVTYHFVVPAEQVAEPVATGVEN